MVMMSKMPRFLQQKDAWVIFACSLDVPMMRSIRPQGICLQVYIQDGLHFRNHQAKQTARHGLYYDMNALDLSDTDLWEARVTDWEFTFWCILHVLSLAVKWSLMSLARTGMNNDTFFEYSFFTKWYWSTYGPSYDFCC